MQSLGMRILVGEATSHIHKHCDCFISDDKVEKECLGFKGASGTRLCISCQTCVMVDEDSLPEDSPLVHYSCTDRNRLIPHTVESVQEVLEGLRMRMGGLVKYTVQASRTKCVFIWMKQCCCKRT